MNSSSSELKRAAVLHVRSKTNSSVPTRWPGRGIPKSKSSPINQLLPADGGILERRDRETVGQDQSVNREDRDKTWS